MTTELINAILNINSSYIHDDRVLSSIYSDAVTKYMSIAENQLCFNDICQYVFKKLIKKKQSTYEHSIMIVKEISQSIGEDFWLSIEYYAPNAKNYRDIYFAIYE